MDGTSFRVMQRSIKAVSTWHFDRFASVRTERVFIGGGNSINLSIGDASGFEVKEIVIDLNELQ